MSLSFDPVQLELAHEIGRLLERHAPLHDRGAYDESLWQDLVAMGLTALPFSSEAGGADGSLKDLAAVVGALARTLAPSPYFATVVLAGLTLAALDDRSTIERIAAGEKTATLIAGPRFAPSAIVAELDGDSVMLSGRDSFVIDGDTADLIVVIASHQNGPVVATIERDAVGVSSSPSETLDFERPLAAVSFEAARGSLVTAQVSVDRLEAAWARVGVAVASEQVAAAGRCVELATEYAKHRKQYGKVIGAYQAIKHRLVDMHIAVELARAATLDAADDLNRSGPELMAAVDTARVLASRAFSWVSEEAIQVHGGIGFTWELPLHRFFRRAKSDELYFGAPSEQLEAIADAIFSHSIPPQYARAAES